MKYQAQHVSQETPTKTNDQQSTTPAAPPPQELSPSVPPPTSTAAAEAESPELQAFRKLERAWSVRRETFSAMCQEFFSYSEKKLRQETIVTENTRRITELQYQITRLQDELDAEDRTVRAAIATFSDAYSRYEYSRAMDCADLYADRSSIRDNIENEIKFLKREVARLRSEIKAADAAVDSGKYNHARERYSRAKRRHEAAEENFWKTRAKVKKKDK